MKKVLVVLVILALAGFGSMAFAADVTVNGSIDFRNRDFQDLDMNKDAHVGTDSHVDTQERVRLEVNVKAGDVKGKVAIENDWDTWGRNEAPQANKATNGTSGNLDLREAWILFPVPNTPINVKAGHMLLQLGEGWFYRSMKFGSDAWVAFMDIDALHLGIVDVKVAEGSTAVASDDTDFYVLVGTVKLNESTVAGLNVTQVKGRPNTEIMNVGAHFGGKIGPVTLKAELDVQSGKTKDGVAVGTDLKYGGNQLVLQAAVAMNPVTINATLARGSGNKTTATDKYDQVITALDADPHYTLIYEYKIAGASGAAHDGFANTTALSVGAMFAATKNLSVGGDVWLLQATEKVADISTGAAAGATTNEIGTEVDVKVNWKLADNLTWNWTLGYLDPGKGLGKDPATGIQGVLSMKF